MILIRKIAIKWPIWLKRSPTVEAMVITWPISCSKCHSVMCISIVPCHLISMVCELSVLMMAESYFRSMLGKIFSLLKIASYIWLHNPWARCCQCLCSIVDSASEVLVWFSISWYYGPIFIWIWWVSLMVMIYYFIKDIWKLPF